MKADQIAEILQLHEMWLREEGGQRASLRGADLQNAHLWNANLQNAYLRGANLQNASLRSANLQGAYLRGANLQNASLRSANLQGADLQGANLQNASLRSANLQGADLQGANGCVRLPVADPRGYDAVAVWHGELWMIAAGCRWLTVAEARKHWGEAYHGVRHIGDRYLYGLDWLETSAEAKATIVALNEEPKP